MLKKVIKFTAVLIIFVVAALAFLRWKIDAESTEAKPLPMSTEGVDLSATINSSFIPRTLPSTGEPQHPFMSVTDTSAMHAGSWESDAHPAAAVFTDKPKLMSRRVGGLAARQCATFTFTSKGYPLILCGGLTSFQLQLIDPNNFDRLAKIDLPMRPSTFESMVKRDPEIIFSDTSSAYFYLDNQDRAIIADSNQLIRRLSPVETNGKWEFRESGSWDMTPYVPNDCFRPGNTKPTGECDALTTIMPDYNGFIWWVTRNGRVGSLDPETGAVVATDFEGEEVQNSFAIAKSGAYIVTDHAMYRIELVDGLPTQR